MRLKYGMNPHQRNATVEGIGSRGMPIETLNGTPSLINFLDALNGWQLVREIKTALGDPAAASFKHVSPAGAAVAAPLDSVLRQVYEVGNQTLSPAALAYVRARGADPKSSFGDFIALSEIVDVATAEYIRGVVSDGIIAPGYESDALRILKAKKSGNFIVFQADPAFEPPVEESREIFGLRLTQDRNTHAVTRKDLARVVCGRLTEDAFRDLILGLITLKYTQSNSIGLALGGQMIGIGAGQQSRVDCAKLAGQKAQVWRLQRHPKVLGLQFKPGLKRQERINFRVRYIEGNLTGIERQSLSDALLVPAEPLEDQERLDYLQSVQGVSFISDGLIPFRDNIDQAAQYGVRFVAEPGGSSRDDEIRGACEGYGMALVFTDLRLFHH